MSKTPKAGPTGPAGSDATRTALVCLLALLTALAAGTLVYTATWSISLACLAGGATLAKAWRFYDWLIR